MQPSETNAPRLTRSQAEDVLRYWLSTVRLEEALNVRPRARRSQHTSTRARMDDPAPGQEYFKLALEQVERLLLARESWTRKLDGELTAFFESWLYSQYRRSAEEDELHHILCFPVVHLPMGELAGLLRCNVRLRFSALGKTFRVPSRGDRQRGNYPAAPDEALLQPAPRAQGTWPFFIDTRLLSYPLGLSSEEIDALFEALRGHEEISEETMLTLVLEALEKAGDQGDAAPAPGERTGTLLERMMRAIKRRLSQSKVRAEVYPVGIVLDGTQTKTTWHLQRELTQLIEADKKGVFSLDSCLGGYLTRTPLPSGQAPQRALFEGPNLTAHQRQAAEHFWGARLSSVQGPPGTGKTTLILHLCAEAILRQVEGLLDHKIMRSDLMLITSSNNRAVDNVMEPLMADGALPLALRMGSRQACEQLLGPQLRRTLAFLHNAQNIPADARKRDLEQSLTILAELRAHLDLKLAPRRQAQADQQARTKLQAALVGVRAQRAEQSEGEPLTLSLEQASALQQALIKVEKRLSALSDLCAAKPSMAQVNAIARHYGHTAKKDLPPLEALLADHDIKLEQPLPPLATPLSLSGLMEVWEEGAELFLVRIAALREQVTRVLDKEKSEREEQRIEAQLQALGPALDELPGVPDHEEESRALFAAAVVAREAWAKLRASELIAALQAALQVVEQERSLRPLFRDAPEHATLLCRLFGVWGSTLLSLGNCLPAELESVARVVIDEAGQCHPAHAVSALLRSQSALIIGDVHQLAPVIDLREEDELRLARQTGMHDKALFTPYRVHSGQHVSAQSVAEQAVAMRHVLVDHFRCQPPIIAISNQLCHYGLTVHTPAPKVALPSLLPDCVALLDLCGEQTRLSGSLCNELELQTTLRLLEALFADGVRPQDVALITPYRGQLQRLRRELVDRRIPLEHSLELLEGEGHVPMQQSGLSLGTVHRFQGGERSIVLFSSVVTRVGALGFLNARPNLLNVAISRARHRFVCIGHAATLRQGPLTRLMVDAARPLRF